MTSADANNQKWHLENSLDGKVRLVSVSSGKVLDLNVSNGKYVQWEDAANENQRWYIEKVGDSYYIRNHVNHSAMGIRDNAMADGDYVISMDFNANADNQKWKFIETEAHEEINLLEEGKYTIGNGSQVVDIYDTGYGLSLIHI